MSGRRILAAGLIAAAALTVPLAAGTAHWRGVSQPQRARVDYMLKCQGCHQPDGSGNAANTPPLKGEVARFLTVAGGREFLGRVPGVASTDLSDERLAELLNWTLYRFDAEHVPQGFRPYTAAEIGALRKAPLRLERQTMRATLVARMGHGSAPRQ